MLGRLRALPVSAEVDESRGSGSDTTRWITQSTQVEMRHDVSAEMQARLGASNDCRDLCLVAAAHCFAKGGEHADARSIELPLDSAPICRECETSCRRMADGETLRRGAVACRRCADERRRMAA